MLKVKNLTKTYGKDFSEVIAVNHLTFTIDDGDFIAITGKSGCGKSTLLHLLAGLDKPTSGNVFYNNIDIYSLNKDKLAKFRRREIGVIYQFYNLLPILSVEENITLPILLDNKKVDNGKLEEILSLLNLKNKRNNLPNQLSGGQQQRTAIGRALIINPSLILADEPTGNLDKQNSLEIMNYFDMLNKNYNQTIVIVTHDTEIANRAKRKITISDGRIIEDTQLQ
jgi:putative ABC transport system ATP-binding protein